jgi:hypothetical protein
MSRRAFELYLSFLICLCWTGFLLIAEMIGLAAAQVHLTMPSALLYLAAPCAITSGILGWISQPRISRAVDRLAAYLDADR